MPAHMKKISPMARVQAGRPLPPPPRPSQEVSEKNGVMQAVAKWRDGAGMRVTWAPTPL
jgi:hypothetical protein